jgi:hypothetical protein
MTMRKHILAAALALVPSLAFAQAGQLPWPVFRGLNGSGTDGATSSNNSFQWGDYTTPLYNSVWDTATAKFVRKFTGTDAFAAALTGYLDQSTVTPTQAQETFAVQGLAIQRTPSGAFAVESGGLHCNAHIASTNTAGRIWCGQGEAVIDAGGDGMARTFGAAIINNGTAQPSIDTLTSKYNYGAGQQGTQPGTVAYFMEASPTIGWYYGGVWRNFRTAGLHLRTPFAGSSATGIDMPNDANWGDAIRLPNAVPLKAYSQDGLSQIEIAQVDVNGNVRLANGGAQAIVGSGLLFAQRTSANPYLIAQRMDTPGAPRQFASFSLRDANGSGTATEFARIDGTSTNITAGAEAATIAMKTMQAGAITTPATFAAGLQVGAPTGGDKGAGTINAAGAYYANGTVGVSCAAGTVNLTTFAVTNGIVTHC